MSETIKFNVVQTTNVESEVSLPYFCKYGNSEYKVISKDESIRCSPTGSIDVTFAQLPFQLGAEPSTENDFNIAYHKALDVIKRKVQ
jgi:hypothetical protein